MIPVRPFTQHIFCIFRSVLVIFGWDRLGRLGHGVFTGFQPSQLFKRELGQLGQSYPMPSNPVQLTEIGTLAHSLPSLTKTLDSVTYKVTMIHD
jgi:hypothetical protein